MELLGGLGVSVSANKEGTFPVEGNDGENGIERQTGGGGSGRASARATYYQKLPSLSWILATASASAGSGSIGTSYSGGTGGGGSARHGYGGNNYQDVSGVNGENGNLNGGAGGNGTEGGTGNPGGTGEGLNGTGGLLILYTNVLNNNGKITSKGSDSNGGGGASGGGSINIFYQKIIKEGEINAEGGKGKSEDKIGGNGGDGCVTLTKNDEQWLKKLKFS